jgi:RNA polymerase sigma-70 factor (ECF subfamily)
MVDELAAQSFRRHYRQIYGFVRRRSASDAEAEDVAAEVFADAAAALERFEPGASPVLALLYTIAKRRLADEARRRNRGDAALTPVAPTYPPEVARALGRALAALPAAQRDVVVLKLIRGLSFREIARTLGATEAACKMRFSRALERMRESLSEEGVEP